MVADATLRLESGGGGSAHFKHEHPDAFSSSLDADVRTAPTSRQFILQAIEADLVKMKVGKSDGGSVLGAQESAAGAAAATSTLAPSATGLLQDMLGCFVLRRTKDSVDLQQPPKTRIVHWVGATPMQARILGTLKRTTLLLLGPESVLGRCVLHASAGPSSALDDAGASLTTDFSTSAGLVVPDAPVCFVGDICGVLPQASDAAACLSDIQSGRVGNASGKLLMLLRKAALHPLLLRSRFSNSRVLALASLLFETSLPQEATFSTPEFSALGDCEAGDDGGPSCAQSGATADADLVALHGAIDRSSLVHWAETQLRASVPPLIPTTRLVKSLADLGEGLLRASVS